MSRTPPAVGLVPAAALGRPDPHDADVRRRRHAAARVRRASRHPRRSRPTATAPRRAGRPPASDRPRGRPASDTARSPRSRTRRVRRRSAARRNPHPGSSPRARPRRSRCGGTSSWLDGATWTRVVHGQSGKRSDRARATPAFWATRLDRPGRIRAQGRSTALPMAAGPRGSQHTDMDGGPRPPPLLASGFRPHAAKEVRHWTSAGRARAIAHVVHGPKGGGSLLGPRPTVKGKPIDPLNEYGHDVLWWLDRMVRTRPGRCRRSSRSSGTTTSRRATRTRRSCCARTGCCASTAWAPSGACCGRSRATRRCSCSSRSPTRTRTRRTRTTPASSWSSSRSPPATTSATSARPPAR